MVFEDSEFLSIVPDTRGRRKVMAEALGAWQLLDTVWPKEAR
jgi:hypothetical protein